MIVVKLQGGLGNQLFQYALGLVLAKRFGTICRVDTSTYRFSSKRTYQLDTLQHKPEAITEYELSQLLLPRRCRNPRFWLGPAQLVKVTDPIVSDVTHWESLGKNLYLDGYWQSTTYLTGMEHALRECFQFKITNPAIMALKQAIAANPEAVSLHIRRGDYVSNPKATRVHGILPLSYYIKALEALGNPAPHNVFVFSDDIEWVSEQPVFSGMNLVSAQGFSAPEELTLMRVCSSHIIANSSFSWWGAWLSGSTNVVAPERWYAEEKWQRPEQVPSQWKRC
jgi:hypothetical protein